MRHRGTLHRIAHALQVLRRVRAVDDYVDPPISKRPRRSPRGRSQRFIHVLAASSGRSEISEQTYGVAKSPITPHEPKILVPDEPISNVLAPPVPKVTSPKTYSSLVTTPS